MSRRVDFVPTYDPSGVVPSAGRTTMGAIPLVTKLGEFPRGYCSAPSARRFHAVADGAIFLRNTFPPSLIGGSPALGTTSLLYGPIGVSWMVEDRKQMEQHRRMGDLVGVGIYRKKWMEDASLVMGSCALHPSRWMGMVSEIHKFVSATSLFPAWLTQMEMGCNWVAGIAFVLYFFLYTFRTVEGLIHLGAGRELREKLLRGSDPIAELHRHAQIQFRALRELSVSELESIAIEEGRHWLAQVAKTAQKSGKKLSLDRHNIESIRLFLTQNPQYLQGKMGVIPSFIPKGSVNELARFGMYMAQERLKQKLEVEYRRLLGADAVDAFHQGNVVQFRALVQSPNWKKEVTSVVLGGCSLAAALVGLAWSSCVTLLILSSLYGISGLVSIVASDGDAFVAEWSGTEFKKRDQWIISMSCFLNLVALASFVAMLVLSGGALLYLPGLLLQLIWLGANVRTALCWYRATYRPWESKSELTLKQFQDFIATRPTEEQIVSVSQKLAPAQLEQVRCLYSTSLDWGESAQRVEEEDRQAKEDAMDQLLARIERARQQLHSVA